MSPLRFAREAVIFRIPWRMSAPVAFRVARAAVIFRVFWISVYSENTMEHINIQHLLP